MSMAFLVNNVNRHRRQNASHAPYEEKNIEILRVEVDIVRSLGLFEQFQDINGTTHIYENNQ